MTQRSCHSLKPHVSNAPRPGRSRFFKYDRRPARGILPYPCTKRMNASVSPKVLNFAVYM